MHSHKEHDQKLCTSNFNLVTTF